MDYLRQERAKKIMIEPGVTRNKLEWLSKGKIVKRFYELKNEVADFMQIKNKPLSELSDPKWICDLAFLIHLTGYLNDLNLKLQKQGQLVNGIADYSRKTKNNLLQPALYLKHKYDTQAVLPRRRLLFRLERRAEGAGRQQRQCKY
ncbi:General transcription factor II-I repeat domain-containing protein 2A [Eumeta japonica]|uniref:General transcription factor II-I repeat domain-containing protein 2A n=1 Tax=Eumeta variegata TaxID=151549 RepID=A0A4C1X6E7_EUMVA|nr:General transcription factor II-I repeat domain-containing protein 2A [Eumeta japonica]